MMGWLSQITAEEAEYAGDEAGDHVEKVSAERVISRRVRESLLGLLLGMVPVAAGQKFKTHGWCEIWQTRLGFPEVCGRN